MQRTNTNPHSNRITLRPLSRPPAVNFPLPSAVPAANASSPLGDWLDLWLDDEIEPNRAETTVNGYQNIIRNHMRPALGKVPLTDLTPELINGYYQWLAEEKGLSPNTIRKHHVLLHTALKAAFRQGVIPVNPALRATPPGPPPATCSTTPPPASAASSGR